MQIGKGPNAHSKDLKIDGVKEIIAVASGKGGVGKSTTAGTFCNKVLDFFWLNIFFVSILHYPRNEVIFAKFGAFHWL